MVGGPVLGAGHRPVPGPSPEVDLEAMETRKVAERHEAQREIMDRLSGTRYGTFKKPVFKIVTKFAQTYMMFRENQRFYLDEQLFRARRLFLEYGRRLAERGDWTIRRTCSS